MRVPDDRRHPTDSALSDRHDPVGHVLVPLVQEDAGDRRILLPHLTEEVVGGRRVLIELILDHPRGHEETDDAAQEQRDPLADRQGPEEAPDGLPDRVVDQEDGHAPLAGVLRRDPHLGSGDSTADLRAKAALHQSPEANQERSGSSAGTVARRGGEERLGALGVELERHRVQRPRAEETS